jgi:hypothetical protein
LVRRAELGVVFKEESSRGFVTANGAGKMAVGEKKAMEFKLVAMVSAEN